MDYSFKPGSVGEVLSGFLNMGFQWLIWSTWAIRGTLRSASSSSEVQNFVLTLTVKKVVARLYVDLL